MKKVAIKRTLKSRLTLLVVGAAGYFGFDDEKDL